MAELHLHLFRRDIFPLDSEGVQTHPGITRVLAVAPRNHNDYQIPVAVIHSILSMSDIYCSMYYSVL